MKNINKILFDETWYRQFVYGLILAALFGAPTLSAGFDPAWTILQVLIVAAIREDYVRDFKSNDIVGGFKLKMHPFNWRNFFFLLVPVLVLYIAITSIF